MVNILVVQFDDQEVFFCLELFYQVCQYGFILVFKYFAVEGIVKKQVIFFLWTHEQRVPG
jgi:hypothetical protein